ncbi:MAG: SPASM domain-containing protein [Candidatus Bathyarchaeia archaeon]
MSSLGTDYVEVSLDFPDAENHDDFRGVQGAFERTVQGIRNCVAEGIYTCIATTVTRLNLQGVPKIIELAKRLKVRRFIAFNFIPTGRGVDASDIDLTPREREQLLTLLYHENSCGEIEVLSTAPQYARVSLESSGGSNVAPTHFYVGEASWNLKVLAEFIGGCGAGRLYCALQPNGDVSPCVFMPGLTVGNLKEDSFKNIWHSDTVLASLRDRSRLHGSCGSCEYRFVCGGCRARAFAYFNDVLASDPGCIHNSSSQLVTSTLCQIRDKQSLVSHDSTKEKAIKC